MQQALRQQPRIRIEAPVAVSGAMLESTIGGIARNLSEGGLYIDTEDLLPVGASVRCEFSLEGQQMTIEGEVAWTQGERQRIDRLAGERDGPRQPLDTQEDATARGGTRADTKTLHKLGQPKPQRKPHSGMGIRFEALSNKHRTLIQRLVEMGDAPESAVQLRFAGLSEPVLASAQTRANGIRLRRQLHFLELGSTVHFGFGKGHDEPYRGHIRRVAISRGERGRVPLLEIDIGLGAPPRQDDPAPGGGAGGGRGPRRFGLSALSAVALLASASGAAATWLGIGASNDFALQEGQSAPSEMPSTAPAPALDAPSGASLAEPRDVVQLLPTEPQVNVDQGRARVWVPMTGSSEQMEIYPLSTPGVAVNLPNASTDLPLENFGIFKGAVTRVWMRPLEPRGVQVRVLYRRASLRPNVSFRDEGLLVELR